MRITITDDDLLRMWTEAERAALALWPDLSTKWDHVDGEYKPVDERLSAMYRTLILEKVHRELRESGID